MFEKVNHGKCVKVAHSKSNFDILSVNEVAVPVLSKEEYAALPKNDVDHSTDTCGNEFMDAPLQEQRSANASFDIQGTCDPNACDVVATRNTYTAAPNVVFKMIWMVFQCPGINSSFFFLIFEQTRQLVSKCSNKNC